MNRTRLSDSRIRRLKPGVREYTVRDALVPALGVPCPTVRHPDLRLSLSRHEEIPGSNHVADG